MKVLVTGGAGFIGSHTVEALLRSGHEVRVLDNLSSGRRSNLPEGVDLIIGDVTDEEVVARVTKGMDAVIHLAALVSVPQSLEEPVQTFMVNSGGTVKVIEAARRNNVRRFVLASTCAVYGDTLGCKDETSNVKPLVPYAASKLQAEHWVGMYARAYGMETVILRYFNVYGPRQSAASPYSGVLAKWCASLRQGRPCIVFGNGEQTRDFIFVRDVATANVLATISDQFSWGDAYNVSTGTSTSLLQVLSILDTILPNRVERQFASSRTGDILHSFGDSSKLRQLGWQPKTSLVQGLKELLEYNTTTESGSTVQVFGK